jgi:hypothetical protein
VLNEERRNSFVNDEKSLVESEGFVQWTDLFIMQFVKS